MVLALVGACVGAQAQSPAAGSIFEWGGADGANGSAILAESMYPQIPDRDAPPAAMQALMDAASVLSRQACAVNASEMGGVRGSLFSYRMKVLESRVVERQTSQRSTTGRSQSVTWLRVVYPPQPACTGWLRMNSRMRFQAP